jgi:hypothetical protein
MLCFLAFSHFRLDQISWKILHFLLIKSSANVLSMTASECLLMMMSLSTETALFEARNRGFDMHAVLHIKAFLHFFQPQIVTANIKNACDGSWERVE